jgi:hypothetical protein
MKQRVNSVLFDAEEKIAPPVPVPHGGEPDEVCTLSHRKFFSSRLAKVNSPTNPSTDPLSFPIKKIR